MKKSIAIASAVASAAALLTVGMAPAQAVQNRALPAGNTLYVMDDGNCVGDLATLDAGTNVASLVGSNTVTAHTSCGYGAAVDPTSGHLYWISSPNSGNHWLMKTDVSTGVSTEVGDLGSNQFNQIAIDDQGNAFATHWGGSAEMLYRVSLVDATTTWVADVASAGQTNSYSFAFNPKDKQFYINFTDDGGLIRRLNVTDGSLQDACTIPGGDSIYGFTFDSEGIGWSGSITDNSDLGSFDVTQSDCARQIVGVTTSAIPQWWSGGVAIVAPPTPPTLPDTGANTSTIFASTAVGLSLVSAGLFAMMMRRRKTSR